MYIQTYYTAAHKHICESEDTRLPALQNRAVCFLRSISHTHENEYINAPCVVIRVFECVCLYVWVCAYFVPVCVCVCVCSCDIYMKASGQVNNQQKKHTSVSARLCCVCVLCWCRKTLWRGEARNSIPFNKHAHTYTHTWAHQFWVLRIICLNWLQFEIELPLIKCINLADYWM